MIYSSDDINISLLQPKDALRLNKLFVSNTERFIKFLPQTLEENTTLDGTQNYIKQKIKLAEEKQEFVFVINDSHSAGIVGIVILKNLDWRIRQGEFAYCIGKHYKGKGLMTKAIKAISNYALENFDLKTLQILTHKTNLSSANVALHSGFKWKRTLKEEFKPLNEDAQDMELFEFSKPNKSFKDVLVDLKKIF